MEELQANNLLLFCAVTVLQPSLLNSLFNLDLKEHPDEHKLRQKCISDCSNCLKPVQNNNIG